MPRPNPQPGARILLLDADDRALLLHVRDPHHVGRTWWELPGGSLTGGESAVDAARRELAEETGIHLPPEHVQHCVWIRESRHLWGGLEQHRIDAIYLARLSRQPVYQQPRRDQLERQTILEQRWWRLPDLHASAQRFLPEQLPTLLADLLTGNHPARPVRLYEDTRHRTGDPSR